MVNVNKLPAEILDQIFHETVKLNQQDNVVFTFGLSQLPPTPDNSVPTKVQKYIRGPTPPYQLRWDAIANLRQVCRLWHDWSLSYAMGELYVKDWRGSERWLDLTSQRDRYPLYEMNIYPKGEKVYRNPFATLSHTRQFLEGCQYAAANVRRLWFNGLYLPETDKDIMAVIRSCQNLDSVSAPWTLLRHGSAKDWAAMLNTHAEYPLQSLELLATRLSEQQRELFNKAPVQTPLISPLVDFSNLRRLKLFGNTDSMPVSDADLIAIARTATNLEEFQMTCISTVTMDGVMAIVRASRKTLRVLEHSPRSDDGFMHPHPGILSDGEHVCDILTSCPKLEDVSISIPTMCSKLFSNYAVRWSGDCQVRALGLCGHTSARSNAAHSELRKLLEQARKLIRTRGSGYYPAELTLELFFADMIFDPRISSVHGDFEEAEFVSNDTWPTHKSPSRKGPYGSTGLYKRDEEHPFDCISEEELFVGLSRNLVQL